MKYFWICLACVSVLFFWPKQKTCHSCFFHHFTQEKSLLAKRFRAKIAKEPPAWIKDQIAKDLSYSRISLDDLASTDALLPKERHIRRYRLVDHKVYCAKGREAITEEPFSHVPQALYTLCHLTKMPDLDLIVNHEDGTWESPYQSELPAPIFGWAKLKTVPNVILIPDYRSLSSHWFNDLRKLIEGKNFLGPRVSWTEKIGQAFWRGVIFSQSLSRLNLCRLSELFPEKIDAQVVGFFAGTPWEGKLAPSASYEEHMRHKYLPVLDGIMCTYPGYQWRLLSGCLTLKQESDQIQWFYGALQPFVHYVPIANDMSNLIDQITWAEENDALCAKIANNAQEFVHSHLLFDDVYHYFYCALISYGKCLDESVRADLKTTAENPNWIYLSE